MSDLVLRVTSGAAAGADIELDDDLLIGRAASGDGTLGGDPELSRQHCRVSRAEAGLLIEDLGSTNGTYVNGVRVTEALSLQPGDTISLGATTLEVAAVTPPVQSTRIASSPVPTTPPAPPAAPTPPPPEPAAAPPAPPPGMPVPPPGFEGPPPGFEGPPPGFEGPPPGFEGPPPGFTGPPPGFPAGPPPGFPEGMPWPPPGMEGGAAGKGGLGMAPPEMVARIKRMAILIALAGLLVGFGIATLIWKVL
jgi:pSer/pThr/pTyr-binding forkhead associated (FHA) protein